MKHKVNLEEFQISDNVSSKSEYKSKPKLRSDNSCKIVGYVLVLLIFICVTSIIGVVIYRFHSKSVKEYSDVSVALLSTKLHNSNETEILVASIEDSDPNVNIKYTYYLGEVTFKVETKIQSFIVKTNYVDENDNPIIN